MASYLSCAFYEETESVNLCYEACLSYMAQNLFCACRKYSVCIDIKYLILCRNNSYGWNFFPVPYTEIICKETVNPTPITLCGNLSCEIQSYKCIRQIH